MLSVANSCDYNENSKKMSKIVYRQMPAPRDLPPQIPAPRVKIKMQKPESRGKVSVHGWGWLQQKLIDALLGNPGNLLNGRWIPRKSIVPKA